jgi:hypothetical protein
MLRSLAIAACLFIAACTTTSTKLADKAAPKPPAGSKILIVQPDIELSLLTVSGLLEPKADWSQTSRGYVASELAGAMQGRAHEIKTLDPTTALEGRPGQLLRLHEAVGASIMSYGLMLPTKKDKFDWTLGEGAQVLGQAYDADYALFTYGRGSYSSGGRKAAFILAAAAGVSIPMGSQVAFASLVDLKTGRVVWFNTAVTPSGGDDLRQPGGAASMTKALLKDVPL